MVHATDVSARQPHITARLALQLLENSFPDSPGSTCPSPSSSGIGVPSETVRRKRSAIRRALRASTTQATTAAALNHSGGAGLSGATSTSFKTLMDKAHLASSASMTRAPASTASSTDFSCGSLEDNEVEDYLDDDACEERGRMGATARALSVEQHLPDLQDFSSGIQRQPSFDERSDPTPLDEFKHPALMGAVGALHGYAASGDPVFLEKGYALARSVAGSKHDLDVSFDACRMALAAGYVHTLIKGTPDMANSFAQQHGLPKLAQSLQPYWSRGPVLVPEEESKWEECVVSLLEVTSSVALMTAHRNILAVLDERVFGGVAEAIGLYLVSRPSTLQQYQEVGSACLRHHVLSLGSRTRSCTDSE